MGGLFLSPEQHSQALIMLNGQECEWKVVQGHDNWFVVFVKMSKHCTCLFVAYA